MHDPTRVVAALRDVDVDAVALAELERGREAVVVRRGRGVHADLDALADPEVDPRVQRGCDAPEREVRGRHPEHRRIQEDRAVAEPPQSVVHGARPWPRPHPRTPAGARTGRRRRSRGSRSIRDRGWRRAVVVLEPPGAHRSGVQRVDHHIGARGQRSELGATGIAREVEHDALLAAVPDEEPRRRPFASRSPPRGSTLTTRAPWSASSIPVSDAATDPLATSSTTSPSNTRSDAWSVGAVTLHAPGARRACARSRQHPRTLIAASHSPSRQNATDCA